jgi:hypothetical protein
MYVLTSELGFNGLMKLLCSRDTTPCPLPEIFKFFLIQLVKVRVTTPLRQTTRAQTFHFLSHVRSNPFLSGLKISLGEMNRSDRSSYGLSCATTICSTPPGRRYLSSCRSTFDYDLCFLL